MNGVPSYELYGEPAEKPFPDLLHCETIHARSSVHGWRIRPHRHHGLFQFFWLVSGGVAVDVEGEEQVLHAPAALIIPPMTVHGFRFEPDTRGWVLTLPRAVVDQVLSEAPGMKSALASARCLQLGKAEQGAASQFEALEAEFRENLPGRAAQLLALAGQVIVWFARRVLFENRPAGEADDSATRLTGEFLDLLERDYAARRPLTGYAADLGVTAPHLNRVCKRVTGRTASALVQARLLLEAKRALTYTSMTVSEIAYLLGFADPAHFSKFFSRLEGQAPSVFRLGTEGGSTEIGG